MASCSARHVLFLIFAGATVGTAAAAEEDDSYPTAVPKRLRGYTLRLPDEDRRLDAETTILEGEWELAAELLDQDGWIVDRGAVIPGIPIHFYDRRWMLAASSASVRAASNSVWEEAFLPEKAHEAALDVMYRVRGPWSAWGQWTRRFAHRSLEEDLTVQYDASLVLVGAARGWAPWSDARDHWWRRVHLTLLGGAGLNRTRYRLADEFAVVESKNDTVTAAFGGEARLSVFGNFWVFVRDLGRVEQLVVEELDLRSVLFLNSVAIGASYAL